MPRYRDQDTLGDSPSQLRRIQLITATPTFKLVAIVIFMFVGIRSVAEHNHDSDDWLAGGAQPVRSVESVMNNWDSKQYIQVVADEEKLCSAVLVWHDTEDIGSRASRTLLYPSSWSPDEIDTDTDTDPALNGSLTLTRKAHLLREARDKYYVRLLPMDELHENGTPRNREGISTPYSYSRKLHWQCQFANIEAEVKNADPDDYDLTIVEKLYRGQNIEDSTEALPPDDRRASPIGSLPIFGIYEQEMGSGRGAAEGQNATFLRLARSQAVDQGAPGDAE